ncbi:MAG: cell division protein FtsX [Planktomarina sp.]
MKGLLETAINFIVGDAQAERNVPPTGFTVRLTVLAAAAMAFLATFTIAFAAATGTLADRWSTDLARTSTIRVTAPETQMAAQLEQVLAVLQTTPGIQSARLIELEEQQELLAPWFGQDVILDQLPVPQLIELIEAPSGFEPQNLQLRLSAEAPGAIFDDHSRWRKPLVGAANRLRVLGWGALLLMGVTLAVIVTLAAQSALAANHQVIKVMRLIGARDSYIAQAFVRRFTFRTVFGAAIGMALAILILVLMPGAADETGFLSGLRPSSTTWTWALTLPVLFGVVAFFATRRAANRTLSELR